jgi:hypothetical protein
VTATFGPTTGLQFVPVTPCLVADTRNPAGPCGGPEIAANSSREFDIPQSACGIPSTAVAYSLNVTVVPNGFLNYLTLWPSGQTQPNVSTLNSPTGAVVTNAAIVPSGTSGDVSVYVHDDADVILDVNGDFAPPGTGGLSLYTVTPLPGDRYATDGIYGHSGTQRREQYLRSAIDRQGIRPERHGGPPGPLNFLTPWPDGETQPNVSTLNADGGAITSKYGHRAPLPMAKSTPSNPTNLILDISSYFAP